MNAKNLFFGIEIEMFIPNEFAECFDVGGYHHGLQIPGAPEGWNMQRDGSLGSHEGYFGVEVVSPKLKGENGLMQVIGVFEQLANDYHAIVRPTCGLHIHVDGRKVNEQTLQKIIVQYERIKVYLYSLNGKESEKRWNNTYCKPDFYRSDRYRGLNVTNYDTRDNRKTVEFRMFYATLDALDIVTTIYTVLGTFVSAVNAEQIDTEKPTIKTFVREIFGKEENVIVPDVFEVTRHLFRKVSESTLS